MIDREQAYDNRAQTPIAHYLAHAAKDATDAGFRYLIFNERIYHVASAAQLRDETLCIDSGKTVADFEEEVTPCEP